MTARHDEPALASIHERAGKIIIEALDARSANEHGSEVDRTCVGGAMDTILTLARGIQLDRESIDTDDAPAPAPAADKGKSPLFRAINALEQTRNELDEASVLLTDLLAVKDDSLRDELVRVLVHIRGAVATAREYESLSAALE